jgi:hypothetical protein
VGDKRGDPLSRCLLPCQWRSLASLPCFEREAGLGDRDKRYSTFLCVVKGATLVGRSRDHGRFVGSDAAKLVVEDLHQLALNRIGVTFGLDQDKKVHPA